PPTHNPHSLHDALPISKEIPLYTEPSWAKTDPDTETCLKGSTGNSIMSTTPTTARTRWRLGERASSPSTNGGTTKPACLSLMWMETRSSCPCARTESITLVRNKHQGFNLIMQITMPIYTVLVASL